MRILTLDIETSPIEAYAWNVWQQNIAAGQIKEPTYMLSYALKVNNGKTVYRSFRDSDFLDVLYAHMTVADAIVTYNGDKFDLLHINREFIEAGYPPLRPVPSIDLLKVVKKNFKFPHNRLDYVCSVLLGEKKLETGGFDLWPEFIKGEPKALRTMERYNKRDTSLTWRLYKFLRPWIRNHPYVGKADTCIADADMVYECPVCGSIASQREQQQRRTRCFAIRQVRCESEDCGHWFDGKRKKIQ
jgi:uncharacterized protein YprB with RNaseH-like and TPR domain